MKHNSWKAFLFVTFKNAFSFPEIILFYGCFPILPSETGWSFVNGNNAMQLLSADGLLPPSQIKGSPVHAPTRASKIY